jgi:hypothetical protein
MPSASAKKATKNQKAKPPKKTAAPVKVAAPVAELLKKKGITPAPGPSAAPAKGAGGKPGAAGAGPGGKEKKKGRKGGRREVDFAAGELLLPGGTHTIEEVHYLMRGAAAAERPAGEVAIDEIFAKRPPDNADSMRAELMKHLDPIKKRFEGVIEPMLPPRAAGNRRTFVSVVERARYRRREIGAFLRGLDLGRTETSHMDSHGEASLQSVMEWAARLENLMESEEPEGADYAQFHRGLDQLENTTEALIIDVELTLRRLRDKKKA